MEWTSGHTAACLIGNSIVTLLVAAPRKIAIAAGVSYLITHVTSVPVLILYAPILNNVNYIVGSGPDTRVLVRAFLEVIVPSPSSVPRRCDGNQVNRRSFAPDVRTL